MSVPLLLIVLGLARADVGTLTEQQLADAINELSVHLNAA